MTPRPTSAGAVDQVHRLLTLVPWLHAGGERSIDDAARRLGTTPAQVVKDLKVLLMVGLPGGYPDDLIDVDLDAIEGPDAEGTIRVSNADYLGRPLQLTAIEASALIVALRALRTGADSATAPVVDRALAKLEVAAASVAEDARRVEVLGEGDPRLTSLRAELSAAVRDGRQVRLTYYVPSRDEESERVVDPHRLLDEAGHDYLEAWCHRAEAPRIFRLDRIHAATVLDSRIEQPLSGQDAPPGGILRLARDAPRVRLRLAPEVFWVTEYYPVDAVTPGPDGTLDAELRVADPRWLRRLLLRLAPHATVLEPSAYAEEFHAEAVRALGLYDGPA